MIFASCVRFVFGALRYYGYFSSLTPLWNICAIIIPLRGHVVVVAVAVAVAVAAVVFVVVSWCCSCYRDFCFVANTPMVATICKWLTSGDGCRYVFVVELGTASMREDWQRS